MTSILVSRSLILIHFPHVSYLGSGVSCLEVIVFVSSFALPGVLLCVWYLGRIVSFLLFVVSIFCFRLPGALQLLSVLWGRWFCCLLWVFYVSFPLVKDGIWPQGPLVSLAFGSFFRGTFFVCLVLRLAFILAVRFHEGYWIPGLLRLPTRNLLGCLRHHNHHVGAQVLCFAALHHFCACQPLSPHRQNFSLFPCRHPSVQASLSSPPLFYISGVRCVGLCPCCWRCVLRWSAFKEKSHLNVLAFSKMASSFLCSLSLTPKLLQGHSRSVSRWVYWYSPFVGL